MASPSLTETARQIEHIDVNEKWTANVSFGGKDHKTLFITASKSLYSIHLRRKRRKSIEMIQCQSVL